MNSNRLLRQLRREATANPKKAGILGLLLVVALWFWAPLVWGWVTPDSATETAVADARNAEPRADGFAEMLAAAGSNDKTADDAETPPAEPWHVLVEKIEQDPLTKAASLGPDSRDPFAEQRPKVVAKPPEPKAPEPVAIEVTPESVGIALSGTIVGPRRRLAFLNGHSYREGETVERVKEGRHYAFRIAEIRPQSVLLTRQGQSFEVNIPPRTGGQAAR